MNYHKRHDVAYRFACLAIALIAVFSLSGCGKKEPYPAKTVETLGTSYTEWAQNTHFTEGYFTKAIVYNEFKDNPGAQVVFASKDASNNDYQAISDEVESFMQAHNSFVSANPDYFQNNSEFWFSIVYGSLGSVVSPDIIFKTGFDNQENLDILGLPADNTFRFAEVDLKNNPPVTLAVTGCQINIPYLILNIHDMRNGHDSNSSYDILKAFPNSKTVIVNAEIEDYDKEAVEKRIHSYLPESEVLFAYWNKL